MDKKARQENIARQEAASRENARSQPRAPSADIPEIGQRRLQLLVLPYAEVRIDGRLLGTTPMKPVSLEAGTYTVWFTHPDYQPLQRRIVIRPGETLKVELDLRREAFPR